MDSIIPLGQKNTLAEYMILSGADNRLPMLDKDLVSKDLWERVQLLMQGYASGLTMISDIAFGLVNKLTSRKHFKTPSLDELRSPGVNLFSNQEDYSEEEVAVSRPKIKDRDHFELKGQFLKELQENTFNGSNHEDANEHIEKVLEIVDLFHVPNITQDQLMLRVFPISLTRAASRWLRNESTGSIKT
ncbi:hypothetical protein Tco_0868130 [Tanacetum coccineum]